MRSKRVSGETGDGLRGWIAADEEENPSRWTEERRVFGSDNSTFALGVENL